MRIRGLTVLIALTLIAAACGGDSSAGGAITIDSPAAGTQFAAGTAVTVQVTARDEAGIGRIDLQVGGATVASAPNPSGATPFTTVQSLSIDQSGGHTIIAVAYRADSSVVGSAQVAITVGPSGDASGDGNDDGTTGVDGDDDDGATGGGSGNDGATGGGSGDDGATGSGQGGGSGDTTETTAGGAIASTTTTTSPATTTTSVSVQTAPDDGGSGQAPTEHEIEVEARNTNPPTVVFEEVISSPGDRGDGLKIIVTNLFNGATQDAATVTLQIQCSPGGPRVRTLSSTNYNTGSACDFLYQTSFEVTYQSYQKNYYIVLPDGLTGYFEYMVIVSAQRH